MPKRTFNERDFIQAVANNKTIRGVLEDLGLRAAGSNYKTVHKYVEKLHLNTSHWDRYFSHKVGRYRKSLEEILVENSSFNRCHLKKRLIKEGLLENKCSICGILCWHGRELSLQLDHINGIWNDNRIGNLRLLCPNCHSLTEDFAGKSLKGRVVNSGSNRTIVQDNKCVDCGKNVWPFSMRCKSCAVSKIKGFKISWPPLQKLLEMVENSSYLAVGRELGVSDNAIRKHIKKYS